MLAINRRKEIITILQQQNSVMVPELSKHFNVTEETIRRDLEKLEKEGVLKRTYGGAVINESTNADLPLNLREITNIEGKRKIGIKVAGYIEDGNTIMLDSSSTALQVAKEIKKKKNITVITNSVKVLLELSDCRDFKIISTGGNLRASSMSFVGHHAEDSATRYNVDIAVICCQGIDKGKGILDSNEMEAEIKKSMVNAAQSVFLVVDNTKFDRVSFVKMLKFSDINYLFTDEKLNEEWETILSNMDVKVVYC